MATTTNNKWESYEERIQELLEDWEAEYVTYNERTNFFDIVLCTDKAYGDSYTVSKELLPDGSNHVSVRNDLYEVTEDEDKMIGTLRKWARKHNFDGSFVVSQYFD